MNKTAVKIRAMTAGGKKLKKILQHLCQAAQPGVTTAALDDLAKKLIEKSGGEASFKKIKGYKWATCLCLNDCVVHGVPDKTVLKAGDILGIDVGLYYRGFHTDTSWTVVVPGKTVSTKVRHFVSLGEKTLAKAIRQAKIGNRIGHISSVIEKNIEGSGYYIVETLIGHGIGRRLHEEPEIPCFLEEEIDKTPKIKEGMTLAIEVIYTESNSELVLDKKDGWTIRTKDGKISGLFEKTVAVTRHGPVVLT